MRKLLKVEGVSGLYKDESKNTFINSKKSEIEAARQRRKSRQLKEQEEQELREMVKILYRKFDRMEEMFLKILEK